MQTVAIGFTRDVRKSELLDCYPRIRIKIAQNNQYFFDFMNALNESTLNKLKEDFRPKSSIDSESLDVYIPQTLENLHP